MEAKHAQNGEDLLSTSRAAAVVGVHAQTLRRYEESGLIRAFRTPGGERRFRRADLLAFRESCSPQTPAEASPHASAGSTTGDAA